jgi:hypothetical protein
MKLISCRECGCVLDTDRICKPEMWTDDQENMIEGTYVWDGDDYVEAIPCPCCKSKIVYSTGDAR